MNYVRERIITGLRNNIKNLGAQCVTLGERSYDSLNKYCTKIPATLYKKIYAKKTI